MPVESKSIRPETRNLLAEIFNGIPGDINLLQIAQAYNTGRDIQIAPAIIPPELQPLQEFASTLRGKEAQSLTRLFNSLSITLTPDNRPRTIGELRDPQFAFGKNFSETMFATIILDIIRNSGE